MKRIDVKANRKITINRTPVLEKYFVEISKYPPLKKEEEQLLFKKYKEENDPEAFDKIIKHNLRFVVSVAKYYHKNQNIDLKDLISAGNIGLIRAVKNFDYKTNNKLISYAIYPIRQEIEKFIRDSNLMYVRGHGREVLAQVKSFIGKYETKFGRQPDFEEIYEYIRTNPRSRTVTKSFLKHIVQLMETEQQTENEPTQEEEFLAPVDVYKLNGRIIYVFENNINSNIDNNIIRTDLYKFINANFTKREAQIFMEFYGICGYEKKTKRELGRKYKIGIKKIENILTKIRRRIRTSNYLRELVAN